MAAAATAMAAAAAAATSTPPSSSSTPAASTFKVSWPRRQQPRQCPRPRGVFTVESDEGKGIDDNDESNNPHHHHDGSDHSHLRQAETLAFVVEGLHDDLFVELMGLMGLTTGLAVPGEAQDRGGEEDEEEG